MVYVMVLSHVPDDYTSLTKMVLLQICDTVCSTMSTHGFDVCFYICGQWPDKLLDLDT